MRSKFARRRTPRGASFGSYGLGEEDRAERIARAVILKRAKAGDHEAVRELGEKYRIRCWCNGGRFIILNGVGVRC